MFSKTSDPTAVPAAGAATASPARSPLAGSGKTSILAADLRVSGDIRSAGQVEVMGEVDGTLDVRGLSVGAEGRITGSVTAETVEVRGRVEGQVSSHSLTVRAAAAVLADVVYANLVIESGAQVEGRYSSPKG